MKQILMLGKKSVVYLLLILTSCLPKETKEKQNILCVDPISNVLANEIFVTFYGNMGRYKHMSYTFYLKKRSNKLKYIKGSFGDKLSYESFKDSIELNKDLLKVKNYLFNIRYQRLLKVYWDSTSNSIVRRYYFMGDNDYKDIRIIGYPKEIKDSMILASDELLRTIGDSMPDNSD